VLSDCGLSKDFFSNLGDALSANTALPIRRIDLSENPNLDDKGNSYTVRFI
jgi:hypothetical protein